MCVGLHACRYALCEGPRVFGISISFGVKLRGSCVCEYSMVTSVAPIPIIRSRGSRARELVFF